MMPDQEENSTAEEKTLIEIVDSLVRSSPSVPLPDTPTSKTDFLYKMQMYNMEKLIDYLFTALQHNNGSKNDRINPPFKKTLDAGSGDGLFIARLPLFNHLGVNAIETTLVECELYCVDKYREKTESTIRTYQKIGQVMPIGVDKVTVVEGQLQDLEDCLGEKGFDFIICNQVLHWLEPNGVGNGDRLKALKNMYDVLKPGGIIALSIAGEGTATEFGVGYRIEVDTWGKRSKENPEGYSSDYTGKLPIGLMSLSDATKLVNDAGFHIMSGRQEVEIIEFNQLLHYIAAVHHYGYREYMRPLEHLSEDKKSEFWNKALERLASIHKKTYGRDLEHPYPHDMQTIYIIARKPKDHHTEINTT